MLLHIVRSSPRRWLLLRSYRIDARLELSPQELQVIRSHRLHRFEVFVDPYRDHLRARADAAYSRQKALPLFLLDGHQLRSLWLETVRELSLLIRARFAFRITIADLIAGVSITNPSLNAILDIEHVLQASVDAIAGTVSAALDYQDGHESITAPEDPDTGTPPDQWTKSW